MGIPSRTTLSRATGVRHKLAMTARAVSRPMGRATTEVATNSKEAKEGREVAEAATATAEALVS